MRLAKIIILSLLFVLVSCGDGTRNDQGVSFTFFGWFADSTGSVGQTGFTIPLAGDAIGIGETLSFAGLQNNMVDQFIRLLRIEHEYFVAGGGIEVPSTSTILAGVIGPAAFTGNGTLPEGFNQGNVTYSGVPVITAEIREFLVLNQFQLPQPPFTLVITSRAVGITSSGKEVVSNPINVEAVVSPGTLIQGL